MKPSSTLQLAIATLLADDTATLAAVVPPKVHLAKAAFVPGPSLDPATLTEADFDGYTAKAITAGSQDVYTDPTTGLITVELKAPVGGWHWALTGITNLPQTIYGWYVLDSAGTVLYGSGLVPSPITLQLATDAFDIPNQLFAFLNQSPQ
jgi:hypothetical protein